MSATEDQLKTTALKQSFSWDGFARTGIAPEALMRGAADIGYRGVDLVEPEQFPLARDCGLEIVCITGHALAAEGLNKRENRPAIERELRPRLDLAAQWNIRTLLCFAGNRYGATEQEAAQITADNLSYFGELAQPYGITLVLELLNSNLSRDYQADHSAWGIQVCRQVDRPNVKLLYDIFHMQIMEGNLINTIRSGHPYFGHYHTAGNPGRHELDEEQEIYYPAVVRAILATGYDGFVAHEFMPKGDALSALKAAYTVCNLTR